MSRISCSTIVRRCFRLMRRTFWKHNIFGSTTSEAGWDLRTTRSKHDGIEARRENPKLGENPNFGIMEFFEEAGGSGNIFHQAHQNESGKIFGIDRGTEIYRKDRNRANGPRSSRWLFAWVQNVVSTQQAECLQKLEVSPCMEAVHAA
ncbi:hypothetical protein YC2023_108166 [Brassica napus]